METKSIIIGTFIKKSKILSFLELLKYKYKIHPMRIFIYEINNNPFEYLVTFKAYSKEPYLKEIPHSSVMHVKNGCLFSINALNKLIEGKCGQQNKDYVVNWDEYKNKLIILSKGFLCVEDITKIEFEKLFNL